MQLCKVGANFRLFLRIGRTYLDADQGAFQGAPGGAFQESLLRSAKTQLLPYGPRFRVFLPFDRLLPNLLKVALNFTSGTSCS